MQCNQSVPIIKTKGYGLVADFLQNLYLRMNNSNRVLTFSSKIRTLTNISARKATAIAPTAIAPEMIPQASITSVITAKLFVQFVVRQQRPLGCRGQPICLIDDDWSYPFATGHWRVDIGAGGDQARRYQECPDGQ